MRGIPSEPSSEIAVQKEPVVIRIDRDLTQANIIIGHLGIRRSNPDYYAISVMNYILGGGGFASRLMTRIRDDMGLAYDVHSLFASNRDRGIFRAGVQTKNESAKTAIAVIIEEMKRMQGESVSDEELKDAKAFLTGSFPRRLDTMGKIANFLALTEFYGLGIDYDKRYPEYIGAITQEDVMRVAQKYLNAHVYVLVIVADLEKTGYADDEQE
jgi:zinc protease